MRKTIIHTDRAPKAIGPYSQAVRAGDFLFLSGQTPLDPATGLLVQGGVKEQAARVFHNLEAVLQAAGVGMDAVVKATVFLKDMNDFATVNEVYAAQFTGDFPARSTVQVARLPKDALVEIEMIAYLGK